MPLHDRRTTSAAISSETYDDKDDKAERAERLRRGLTEDPEPKQVLPPKPAPRRARPRTASNRQDRNRDEEEYYYLVQRHEEDALKILAERNDLDCPPPD